MSKFLDYAGLGHFKEKVDTKTNIHITSYTQFPLRLLVPTSYATLTDGANPTRIRNIMYVPAGTVGTVASTDTNGVGAALYDTASHATNFKTDGRLEEYGSNVASCSFKTTQAGWLLVSLSNGTTVITDERKQELLDSLTIDITLPSLYADKTVKLSNEALLYPIEALGGYIAKNFISNSTKTWNGQGMHYMIPATNLRGKRFYARSAESSVVRYAFLTSSTSTASTRPDFCSGTTLVTVEEGGNYVLTTIPNDCNYIYIYATYNTSTYFPASVAIIDSVLNDAFDLINGKTEDIEAVNSKVDTLIEGLNDVIYYGNNITTLIPSAGETYNAYYKASLTSHFSDALVDTTANKRLLYYPEYIVNGGQTISVTTTALNAITIFELPYRTLGSSPIGAFTSADILRRTTIGTTDGAGTFEMTLLDATRRLAFVMGATQDVATSPSDITNNITSVTLPIQDISSSTLKSDSRLNEIRQAKYVNSAPIIQSLGILHYTDIHGDNISSSKIQEYISTYQAHINAVVNTGDAAQYYADATSGYPHGSEWWRGSGLAEKSLFVLGNHDGALATGDHVEGSADWDAKGKAWDYDTYFADYISTLGITMPTGYNNSSSEYYKSCFWHKDFADAKVRIIGLDCMHFNDGFHYNTSEQETWLAARLADTLDSNNTAYDYSVIFLAHYPIDDWSGDNETWNDTTHKFVYNNNATGGRVMSYKTGTHTNFHFEDSNSLDLDRRFCMRAKTANASATYGYEKSSSNPIGDIIQAWVGNGGKYVAWLCGHCHYDMMFYSTKYPDLLCVTVNQAGNLRGTNNTDRGTDLDSRVCANFYSVDTQNGLFKIVRFGLTMDRFMANINTLCYDYINKKVINEC